MTDSEIRFVCNGKDIAVRAPADASLADVLRGPLRLTGTKVGCGTGDCGACTVIVDGRAVCSCILPAAMCEGREVETVESVAATELGRAVVEEFERCDAVQCGICSPGFVVAAASLIGDRAESLDRETIQAALSGNLCRCTGYRPIIDAVEAAARRWADEGDPR